MPYIGNTGTESANSNADLLFINPNFEPSYSMAELNAPSSQLREGCTHGK